jgi:hypothetical protein
MVTGRLKNLPMTIAAYREGLLKRKSKLKLIPGNKTT